MLAEEDRCAGRGRLACWQRKPNVLVVEDDRVVGERQMLWQCGGSALVEEDRCFLLWKTSVLAVEDECVCCGSRVCRQGKTSVRAVEDERAGSGSRACWQRKTSVLAVEGV